MVSHAMRDDLRTRLIVSSLIVVDQALEVVEEYQGRILKIEQAVLLKPSMKTVRRRQCPYRFFSYPYFSALLVESANARLSAVHILQGDLILHKRTLEPIKTVIYGLRRYDVDRALALRDPDDVDAKLEGYMSHKSKIYLVRSLESAIGVMFAVLLTVCTHLRRLTCTITWNTF